MIKKFKKIKNVGSFQHFSWSDVNPAQITNKQKALVAYDTDYKKYNILYGENGTGKSTIVRILKSLHFNDSRVEKNWDRETENREIEISTDGTNDTTFFEANGWQNNNLEGKFVFFDRDFINSHIHSFPLARESGHDKNTGKLILLLGDFGSYKEQLDKLVGLQDDLTKKNEALRKEISFSKEKVLGLQPEESIGETFNKIQSLPDSEKPTIAKIEPQIIADNANLKKIEKILVESEAIEKLAHLIDASQKEHIDTDKIKEAFAFSVGSGTVAVLEKIKGREYFIQIGLKELHENKLDNCPFCEQEIKSDEEYLHVIKEYEKVFDNEFAKNQNSIEQTLNSYKNLLLSLLRSSEPSENRVRLETSNKLLSREDKLENIALEQSKIDKIQQEIRLVDDKLKNILTKYENSGVDEVINFVDNLNTAIIAYNKTAKTINEAIDKTKKELGTGDIKKQKDELSKKIQQGEKELFVIKNFGSLSNIRLAESKHEENKKKIVIIKTILDAFIEKVKKKFKEFVDTYFSEIEKYVSVFCPSIEVKIVSPRVTYDLRSDEVVCGFEVRYKDKDRFSYLSDGEKQSVALAYFLALLSKTRDKEQKIVVFDDPINSFDAGRRKMCAEYILKEVIAFKQSFVLTCDPLFRTYARKAVGRKFGDERMEYYVLRSASSSIHHRNENQATIYAIFKTDFKKIDSVLGTDENIIIFGQTLRYCIEEVKDKYLGYGHDSLDHILTQVKGSNFEKFKNSIDDLMEIYTYCNTGGLAHYPRDGKTSWDELKMFVKRYLKLEI